MGKIEYYEEGRSFKDLGQFLDFLYKPVTTAITEVCLHYVWRGHASYDYEILPSGGRIADSVATKKQAEDFYRRERFILEIFKSRTQQFHFSRQPSNEIEWLALAQHYGVKTRLLDWTMNPLTALFFACELDKDMPQRRHFEASGALLAYHVDSFLDPMGITDVLAENICGFVLAPFLTQRLVAQSALFSIHGSPWVPLKQKSPRESRTEFVQKCKISPELKVEAERFFNRIGMTKGILMADLDSFASEISIFADRKCRSNGGGWRFEPKP